MTKLVVSGLAAVFVTAAIVFLSVVGIELINLSPSVKDKAYDVVFAEVVAVFTGSFAMIRDAMTNRDKVIELRSSGNSVPGVDEFGMDWKKTALYSSVALFIVGEVILFISAAVNNVLIVFLLFPVISYFIGRWIGRMSNRQFFLAIIVTAFVGRTFFAVVDFVIASTFIPIETLQSIYNSTFAVGFVIGSALFIIFAYIGSIFGRRTRDAAYLQYLLCILPVNEANALVELARDQANEWQRRRAATVDAAATATQAAESPA